MNSEDYFGEDEKMLETKRLILRRWNEDDAEDLYRYASDPDVGPIAGWPAHRSIEEIRDVIKNVFDGREAYAICLKEDRKAIGAIELKLNGHTDMTDRDDECELGYWLGKPFWGQGIVPEAAGRCFGMPLRISGCRKSGADIMRAMPSRNGFRKSAASVINGPRRVWMFR